MNVTDASEIADLAISVNELPTLAFSHPMPLNIERISPILNINHVKPKGGLWLSPRTPSGNTVWLDWLGSIGSGIYDEDETFITENVKLTENARILRIDSYDDFARVLSRYLNMPFLDSGIPLMQNMQFLDFEAMALDWDAFYLTARGQRDTHRGPDGDLFSSNLYGWDLETVLVLNKSIIG